MLKKTAIFCAILTSACTAEMQAAWDKEVQATKDFEYIETLSELTQIYPTDEKRRKIDLENNQQMCVHEDTYARVITESGINDERYYDHCPTRQFTQPYGQRLEGRDSPAFQQ